MGNSSDHSSTFQVVYFIQNDRTCNAVSDRGEFWFIKID